MSFALDFHYLMYKCIVGTLKFLVWIWSRKKKELYYIDTYYYIYIVKV